MKDENMRTTLLFALVLLSAVVSAADPSITIQPANVLNYSQGYNAIVSGNFQVAVGGIVNVILVNPNGTRTFTFTVASQPKITNSITLNSSNITSSHLFNLSRNISVNVTVNKATQWNNVTQLGYGNVIRVPFINATFKAPKKLNFTSKITPLWNNSISVINSSIGLNVTILQIKKLGLNLSVSSGGFYRNMTYGINVTGKYVMLNNRIYLKPGSNWTYNSTNTIVYSDNLTNQSVIESVFNHYALKNCAAGANVTFFDNTTNTPVQICERLNGMRNFSILPIIASFDLSTGNLTQGIGQGMVKSYVLANATANTLSGELASETSLYNIEAGKLSNETAQYNSAIQGGQLQADEAAAAVFIVIGLVWFFDRQQKKAREAVKR